MSTTVHFQTSPDYFATPEECDGYKFMKTKSNPRYSNFFQTHFTAGDEHQFEEYRNKSRLNNYSHDLKLNCDVWHKYHKLTAQTATNTFKYIFHKFKKGIFVQIKDNSVKVMLPFSKHSYTNEWNHLVAFDRAKYATLLDVFRRVYDLDSKRVFNEKRVNKYKTQWYANNALVRYEYPINENDSGVGAINDMLLELCKEFDDIPDMEFFVNKRDHPILRKDGCEPYDFIFGDDTPLTSHNYPTYTPILSMCSGAEFADVAMPTWDDWARVCASENKFFPKCPTRSNPDVYTEWANKTETAVFRGSSTGFGLTAGTNMRLRIALMSLDGVKDIDGVCLLDAGLTSWNVRPRIVKESRYIDTFDEKLIDAIPIVPFMDMETQASFKYIVNIDGHVSAFRLSAELGSRSVVLIVQSKFKLWYAHMLEPYVHYIPVRADLCDLYTQIKWCKSHDAECFQITQNALAFQDSYLSKQGILAFMRNTLVSLKCAGGEYTYRHSPLDIQAKDKWLLVDSFHIPSDLPPFTNDITTVKMPSLTRTFDLLQGIQWMLSKYDLARLAPTATRRFNRHTELVIYEIDTVGIMKKCGADIVNDAVMGLYCVNPILKYIPNFSYTFYSDNKVVYTEYFAGCQTLFDYIKSDRFVMKEYVHILLQIALAIHTAQQQCLFIHYDLYPWNVILKRTEAATVVNYTVGSVKTRVIPVIIDYGKSRGVVNGMYYGVIKPYTNSTIHDILCVLISSMYNVVSDRTLSRQDLNAVFTLSEFFSNTTYTNNKKFATTRDLKSFLYINKKYSAMLNTPKHELEGKTPLDFVSFIVEKFRLDYSCVGYSCSPMRSTTGRLVYNYLNASTDTERLAAYRETLDRIYTCTTRDVFSFRVFSRVLECIRIQRPDIKVDSIELDDDVQIADVFLEYDDLAEYCYDEDVFNDDDRCSLLKTVFTGARTCPDIIETRNFIIECGEECLDVDSVRVLKSTANRNTFLYLYDKVNCEN